MRFELGKMHGAALGAFDEMEKMACIVDLDTRSFSERDFTFQIARSLHFAGAHRNQRVWMGFECPFEHPHNRKKCDIVVKIRGPATSREVWIEVKSTGLDRAGYRGNGFGSLGWEKDFEKLRRVREPESACAWIWLYQLETYQQQIQAKFGNATTWATPEELGVLRCHLGTANEGNTNLPSVLGKINVAVEGRALASIRPRVRTALPARIFSAMIVTAMVRESDDG